MTGKATGELGFRQIDGVEVALLWPVGERWVLVRVADGRVGRSFELWVEGGKARDAFGYLFA